MSAARSSTELRARFRVATGDYVSALDVSRDGSFVVVGLGDGRVLGFDVATGAPTLAIEAHPAGVLGVALAPDGSRILSCGAEPHARVWSRAGAPLRALEGGGGWVEHAAWSPDGTRLAIAAGKRVRVFDAEGAPVFETEPLASAATALVFRADGAELAATCYGGVVVAPLREGGAARQLAWKGSLVSLAWSPDGRILAAGTQDGTVQFWRLPTGRSAQMSGYPCKPKALAFDHAASLLATSGDTNVTVWDFRGRGPEGTSPLVLEGHRALVSTLAFAPRRGLLASGSEDTSVLLWEPRRGRAPVRFAFLDETVTRVAWCPTGQVLLGADAAGTLAAWDAP